MRRKSTFLLTILPAETSEQELHGSLKAVADGSSATFSNLDELYQLIHRAIADQGEEMPKKHAAMQSSPSHSS